MRLIRTALLGAITLFLLWMLVAAILSYWDVRAVPKGMVPDSWAPPDSWSEWRDIMIVISGAFWALAGLLFAVLAAALIFLALLVRRVIKEHGVPAIDSLKESLDNVRGTTEFAGETIASPIVRTYAIVKGVRSGVGAVTNLPDRIRRRKKGKK